MILDARPQKARIHTCAALEAHQPASFSEDSSGQYMGCNPGEASLIDDVCDAVQSELEGEEMLAKTGAPEGKENLAAFGKEEAFCKSSVAFCKVYANCNPGLKVL